MVDYFQNEILPLFEEHRGDYLAEARAKAEELAELDPQGICTIEMVRAHCPVPEGVNPNVLGAVFRGPKNRWELIGYVKSNRASSHGRRVGVYQLQAVTPQQKMTTLLAESVGTVTGV